MGGGASTSKKRSDAMAASQAGAGDPVPEYRVSLLVPQHVGKFLVRIDKEALHILEDNASRAVWRSYPFYKIMCWGHTHESFQFRVFGPTAGELTMVVVGTREGTALEGDVMSSVKRLMADMDARGVSEEEFVTIRSLVTEDADGALAAIRSAAVARAFDAKQASELVTLMGEYAPFEQLEAAVALYPSLLNPASFKVVLDVLGAEDAENVRYRLGIKVDSEGNIIESRQTKRVLQKSGGEGGEAKR
jgi:hypothetical protein